MKFVFKFRCIICYFKIKKYIYYNRNMLESINLFKNEVALVWEDKTTSIIKNSTLRQACPCAYCSGEKDVLGNQYGGIKRGINKDVSVVRFDKIGYYGLQFFFSDGHKDGIYTFEFLKTLSQQEES